jgi:nitrite reductase/ring-hydroxylating ferredoxin subunit
VAGYVVASVDEIPPGSRKIVEVAGRSIGVFNLDGAYFALRNRCPHQGGPLCLGRLSGMLTSPRPGEYEYQRDGEILRCPWHGWEFDLRTGQSWIDPVRLRVRTYPVSVQPCGGEASERVPGPYVAERYDVTVEQELVVVHIGE